MNAPDGNNFNIIFELSTDNFTTISNTYTISNQSSGSFSHAFSQLIASSYNYRVRAENISSVEGLNLCSGFTNSIAQSQINSFSIVQGPCDFLTDRGTASSATSAVTSSSVCITPGPITLYPGDSINNNDICSNDDIAATNANPTFPVVQEGILCNSTENSISLGSISTLGIRQNPTSVLNDVLFDDLRGQGVSGYTITAEISNLVDYNNASNIIELGANPDGVPAVLDQGSLTSVVIDSGGSGYNSAPIIAFVGGNGSGATAIATVSGGVIAKIDIKNYGIDYTSVPTVVMIPTSGGTGATATANIIEAGSNLNPVTYLPEANIFVTLDPSVGTVSKIKPNQIINPSNFITGPRSLITTPAVQYTLYATTLGVSSGRYDLDNTIFGLRVPAYIVTGDYRATITQTIVIDSGIVNTPPLVGNSYIYEVAGSIIQFSQGYFASLYADTDSDPMVSVKIFSLPTQGILKLNGTDVVLDQVISATDLDGLEYVSLDQDYSTSFNWSANDSTYDSNIGAVNIIISIPQN